MKNDDSDFRLSRNQFLKKLKYTALQNSEVEFKPANRKNILVVLVLIVVLLGYEISRPGFRFWHISIYLVLIFCIWIWEKRLGKWISKTITRRRWTANVLILGTLGLFTTYLSATGQIENTVYFISAGAGLFGTWLIWSKSRLINIIRWVEDEVKLLPLIMILAALGSMYVVSQVN